MENATIGRVTAAAKVENLADTVLANAGHLKQEEIRVLEIPDALVDTGATRLSLPRPVIDQLGLTRYGLLARSSWLVG